MTLSAIPITPIHFNVIDLEGHWDSPAKETFNSLINPTNDPVIHRLNLWRYNLMRYGLRHREFARQIWSHLPIQDQLIAEAKVDTYDYMTAVTKSLELQYGVWSRFEETMERFRADLADPKAPAEIVRMAKIEAESDALINRIMDSAIQNGTYNVMTNEDFDRWIRMGGILRSMLWYPNLAMAKYEMGLKVPSSYENEKQTGLIARPVSKQQQLMYSALVNHVARLQHDLDMSWNYLMYEFYRGAQVNNRLKGVAAKGPRALMVDGGIPLPTPATFLGWFQLAGLAFYELLPRHQQAMAGLMGGILPTHILTYLAPMMPKTKEHGAGGAIQNDESHADHSLSVKSSGHRRDTYGQIHYGHYRLRTVLIAARGVDSIRRIVLEERNPGALSNYYAHTVSDSITTMMLPSRPNQFEHLLACKSAILPGVDINHLNLLSSNLFDPYVAGYSSPLRFLTANETRLPIDVGYRAIAKKVKIHFRFDTAESLDTWCEAFEQCAIQHINASEWDMTMAHFNAALAMSLDEALPEVESKKTKAGTMTYQW